MVIFAIMGQYSASVDSVNDGLVQFLNLMVSWEFDGYGKTTHQWWRFYFGKTGGNKWDKGLWVILPI